MKKQGTLEEYDAAAKAFLGRLSLLVRGLHQDQLMVIFRATLPNWYNTSDKSDKLAMSESFEAAQTWIDSQLIGKMRAYTRLWYSSPAGAKYHKGWHFAKLVVLV